MTIILTADQINHMGRANFNSRLVVAIRSAYPTQTLSVSTEDLFAVFDRERPKAEAYGLRSESQVAAFLHAAWLFGEDFDRRIPVVKQILCDANIRSEMKAEALGNFAASIFRLMEKSGSGVLA